MVDVARQDEVDRVFEKDGLERTRKVGRLFKLARLGEIGVEKAVMEKVGVVCFL